MAASDRYLSPRAARDWWTKGLLPRPRRRGLGRAKGTVTLWTDLRVVEQAKAAYDLLARHNRTYAAIIGLWLWGFPIDLKLVRRSYLKLIDRHIGLVGGQCRFASVDDLLGNFAAEVARRVAKSQKPPRSVEEISDLAYGALSLFYGLEGDIPARGLAALCGQSPSEVQKLASATGRDLEVLARYVRRRWRGWISLPKQRETLLAATDHDLSQARRVLHLAFGCCARVSPPEDEGSDGEFGRDALIAFGRPMLLILVRVLHEPMGKKMVSLLLQFSPVFKRGMDQHLDVHKIAKLTL